MTLTALSTSRWAAELLAGPRRRGRALGHGYILFGDDVLAVTQPGAPRMPNGLESGVRLEAGETALVGDGSLRTAAATIGVGQLWDSRPSPRFTVSVRPTPAFELDRLAGCGPGLTPLGDDILVGYLAGSEHAGRPRHDLAERAAMRTSSLSRTLLQLAADGQLPEVAHRLLEDGDPEPLLAFGSTSGAGIALGLAASNVQPSTAERATRVIEVPLERGATRYYLAVEPVRQVRTVPTNGRG